MARIRTEKPTIPQVVPLIRAYYAKPGNSMGGAFHIIFEDDNTEQHWAEICLERAREQGDPDGIEIGELLVRMSRSQRHRLFQDYSFYPEA